MDTFLSKSEFYSFVRRVRDVDRWCPNGRYQGVEAKRLLQPFRTKKGRVPVRTFQRFQPYLEVKKTIAERHSDAKRQLSTLVPSTMSGRKKKKTLAFARLFLQHERRIVPTVHLIFEECDVSWNLLLKIYDAWKQCESSCFASFLIQVYKVLRGDATSFFSSNIISMQTESEGQRYVGNDFWKVVQDQTGVNWEDENDVCPRGTAFLDALTYQWPSGRVFLNPPFSHYSKFYKYAMQQFDAGNLTEILFVMPFNRFHGYNNREPSAWVKDLKERRHKHFDLRYAFYLPDGTRCEDTFHIMCVHVF